ncbi:MAG TPA: MlaD family protein [Flavobacteriaceae bacterium]|nr:MlaD family protein [Flavobacteriaceae bacterium]
MKNRDTKRAQVGLLVSIGTLLFVGAVYLIGQKQELFKKTITVSAYFRNVSGLKGGNNVRYSGMDIGTVKRIYMLNDTVIKVDMTIDQKIISHLKKDAIATIGADGLVGNMIVNIVPGKGRAPEITNGDVLESYSKISADDILSTLSVTNENAAILTSDLLKITNKIVEGKGTIGIMLNDTLMANNLRQTVSNLKKASQNAATGMHNVNALIESIKTNNNTVLGVLINDTLSGEKLKTTVQNMEALSVEITRIAANVNQVVQDIQTNRGTLHYILNDTTLVENLKSSADHIREGTEKFNQNMEALKHNFLFRGYFKKQERQAKKDKP